MEVLIVSKTRMSNSVCVGGLVLENNRYVRLLNPDTFIQPTNTEFEVGDIWDLNFTSRPNIIPPHIEDVVISKKLFVRKVDDMHAFIRSRNIINWNGHINNLFDGLLNWTNSGAGYISVNGKMPTKSVGFWVADKDLFSKTFDDKKTKFYYPNGNNYRNVSYVGFQETLPKIAAGTILRVSLSRIFPSDHSDINVPKGFYLQLSGWY